MARIQKLIAFYWPTVYIRQPDRGHSKDEGVHEHTMASHGNFEIYHAQHINKYISVI